MNQTHLRQRRHHALGLLLRSAPFLIVGALAAAWSVWTLLGSPQQVITVRQRMAVQNVSWTDIAATHARNEIWLESEKESLLGDRNGVDLTLELPDDRQLTLFSFVATANNVEQATAIASQAAERLLATQGGYVPVTISIREALLAESADLELQIATRDEALRTMRAELDQLIAQSASISDRDSLGDEIFVLELQRAEMAQRAIDVELQISSLDVTDLSALSIIERLGEPVVRLTESDVRFRSALLAGFVAASLIGAILLWIDARRSPLRTIGQVRYHFPDLEVIDLTSRSESEDLLPAGTEAALFMRLRDRIGAAHALVVPAGPESASREAVSMLKTLQSGKEDSYTAVTEEADTWPGGKVDHVILAITPDESRGSDVVDALRRVSDIPPESIFALFLQRPQSSV